MKNYIGEEIKNIKADHLWRSLSETSKWNAAEAVQDGKSLINFSTNDYLGYSQHPEVIEAAISAVKKYGTGGRSSRLISGTLDLHSELEKKLAAFKKTEAALLFPSGFMANLGVLSVLLGEGDAVIMDRLNHASLVDAAKLSKCRMFVYEHRSVSSLEKVRKRTGSYRKRPIVTDSLLSME